MSFGFFRWCRLPFGCTSIAICQCNSRRCRSRRRSRRRTSTLLLLQLQLHLLYNMHAFVAAFVVLAVCCTRMWRAFICTRKKMQQKSGDPQTPFAMHFFVASFPLALQFFCHFVLICGSASKRVDFFFYFAGVCVRVCRSFFRICCCCNFDATEMHFFFAVVVMRILHFCRFIPHLLLVFGHMYIS